jgi:hypothetical protein
MKRSMCMGWSDPEDQRSMCMGWSDPEDQRSMCMGWSDPEDQRRIYNAMTPKKEQEDKQLSPKYHTKNYEHY